VGGSVGGGGGGGGAGTPVAEAAGTTNADSFGMGRFAS
jgi:hypothetical protein